MGWSRRRDSNSTAALTALVDVLASLPRSKLLAGALLLVALTGAADYITGPDLSFSAFYLIPVFFSAAAGRARAAAVAVVAAATWSGIDIATRIPPHEQLLAPLWNTVVRLLILALVAALVAALHDERASERILSRTDPLTRVGNARAFYEAAQAELHRMERTRRPLTVAYIDVDDFKAVNAAHGHTAGDEVLAVAAKAMASDVRRIDVVARLGGDEFAVLLPETQLDEALSLLNRLHIRLQTATGSWTRGFSIGAVTFTIPPRSVDELIKAADRVMYDVKRTGKNSVRCQLAPFAPESAPTGAPPDA